MPYRKVYPHMWNDAKVRALSPMPPSGQALWVHLLCGEQTGPLPGLFRIGEAAFAEQLGWDLEAFREAFREAFQQGLVKADWKARLVWVPNALKWNPPQSANVVKFWASAWLELPACELKHEAWRSLKGFMEGLGKGFQEAFTKDFPESVAIAVTVAITKEPRTDRAKPETFELVPKMKPASEQPSPIATVRRAFLAGYAARYPTARAYPWGSRENGQTKNLLKSLTLEELLELIRAWFAWKHPKVIAGGHAFGTGPDCLVWRYIELRADLADPERRRDVASINQQNREAERNVGNQDAVAEALRNLEVSDEQRRLG